MRNLTIDGMTVDYTATVDTGDNYYHTFGVLAGFVGNGFSASNVTVKNVTMNLNLCGEEAYNTSAHRLPAECIGGLIGYAKGTVSMTNCKVEGMTVNITDGQDGGGTQFLIGGLIGYADAYYTLNSSGENSYGGSGKVNIEGCTVSGLTVNNKNEATGITTGALLGGIGKSVTTAAGKTYSVTASIDEDTTYPTELACIGKELTLDYSTASESAVQSRDALLPADPEEGRRKENAVD